MAETIAELIQEGKDPSVVLTEPEKVRLKECELIIKRNLNTFLEVGYALSEIRDNRLYRRTHKTFEKYCKDVWDLSKAYANRQICGYQTIVLLKSKMVPIGTISENDQKMAPIGAIFEANSEETATAMVSDDSAVDFSTENDDLSEKNDDLPEIMAGYTGTICEGTAGEDSHSETAKKVNLPMNEAQIRPLTRLSPDKQVEAWNLVLQWLNEGKKLTSYLVGKAVKEVNGGVEKRKLKDTREKIDSTQLVSKIFKKQYQVMVDIISDERNNGWKTSKQKEIVRWLKTMVKIAESEI